MKRKSNKSVTFFLNAMDVRQTVEHLAGVGVRVHCLVLGGVDLTSPAGKMTMQVLSAVAEFERDLSVERTRQGLIRAKAEGKQLGRPVAVDTTNKVQRLKKQGVNPDTGCQRIRRWDCHSEAP